TRGNNYLTVSYYRIYVFSNYHLLLILTPYYFWSLKMKEYSDKRFVRAKDLSKLTGLSVRFFAKKRLEGGGPPFYRISQRAVLYEVSETLEWVKNYKSSSINN
ncbi:hypothetical protein K8I31_11855, partial [bacterium]|nr:hypothetical protein [bacterium]